MTRIRHDVSAARTGRGEPVLRVRALPWDGPRAACLVAGRAVPCVLGRAGLAAIQREGDGASPRGRYVLTQVLYRPDRVARPRTRLPVRPLRMDEGWCDDPADGRYNRPVRLPCAASHEAMWREDGLYDIVVVLSHNQMPRVRGRGSAVFAHCWRDGRTATAGCVAFAPADLRRILALCGPGAAIEIAGPAPRQG